jgi:hypothetical protein
MIKIKLEQWKEIVRIEFDRNVNRSRPDNLFLRYDDDLLCLYIGGREIICLYIGSGYGENTIVYCSNSWGKMLPEFVKEYNNNNKIKIEITEDKKGVNHE